MLQLREELRELPLWTAVHLLWVRKWVIFTCALTLGLLALLFASLMTRIYSAEVVVVPASGSAGMEDVLSKLGGGLGGLASIAGLAAPQSDEEKEALGTLHSKALISNFITQNNLMPVLYPDQWDAAHHSWKPSKWGRPPTLWRATQLFDKSIRTIVEDRASGTITLTVEWKRPGMAAAWANGLIDMANAELQARAIDEADRDIAYLNDQLARTSNVDLQQSIYQIMEQQIKVAMIARGRKEFAFRVVDPAVVAERPVRPKRGLTAIIGFLVGMLGSAVLMLRTGFAASRRQ